MFDYLVKDAWVLDGTGIPGYRADVAIMGDKIAALSTTTLRIRANRVIDGKGLYLCPGFVDMHTHADVSIFSDQYASNLALQGVSVAVLGSCGSSPGPFSKEVKRMWEEGLPWAEDRAQTTITWSDFTEYMSTIDEAKFSINVMAQIGHNSIRSYVMGHYNKESKPTPSQIEQMRSLVGDAMKSGAVGMSSGLIYTPGVYSNTEELIELCKVVSEFGGIYSTHVRGEANELLQSVTEAIRIAEKAGVSTQISHHKAECRVN